MTSPPSSDGGTDKMQERVEPWAIVEKAMIKYTVECWSDEDHKDWVKRNGKDDDPEVSLGGFYDGEIDAARTALSDAGYSLVRLDEKTRERMVETLQSQFTGGIAAYVHVRAALDAALSVLTDSTKEAGT